MRLSYSLPVYWNGQIVFRILDYGPVTRYRAKTFERKEPETLTWISSFDPADNLLDIGANIGIYTLFAAARNHNVISLEPDALNYALLNLNIRLNDFCSKVIPYSIAAHNITKYSSFSVRSCQWGGALNSFDTLENLEVSNQSVHTQGVYGVSLDTFLDDIEFQPNHIKIDVDGNENLILRGASQTLLSPNLKSILIELDESSSDYTESLGLILQSGFFLHEKSRSRIFDNTDYSPIYNHIFMKH